MILNDIMETGNFFILFFFSLVFLVSLVMNILLLIFTVRIYKRELATNVYISGICVADILSLTFGVVPEFTVNYDRNLIRSDNIPCVLSGLVTFAFCITTMNLFSSLAFVQTIAIAKPFFYRKYLTSVVNNVLLIIIVFFYGFAWSIIPFPMGSHYVPDLDKRRCSVDWKLPSMKIYIGFTVLIGFCIPILMQVVSLYVSKRRLESRQQTQIARNRVRSAGYDRFYVRINTLSLGLFMAAWTPYSVVGTMVSFGFFPSSHLFTVCALSAKLATLCNPIIYFCHSRRFNTFVKHVLKFRCVSHFDENNTNCNSNNSNNNGVPNLKQFRTKDPDGSNERLARHVSITSTIVAVIANVDVNANRLPSVTETLPPPPLLKVLK